MKPTGEYYAQKARDNGLRVKNHNKARYRIWDRRDVGYIDIPKGELCPIMDRHIRYWFKRVCLIVVSLLIAAVGIAAVWQVALAH